MSLIALTGMFLLAGLIQDSDSHSNTGIPWLKDIPILGFLTGTQNNSRTRTELLLLITPRVIHDQRDARAATEELRAATANVKLKVTDASGVRRIYVFLDGNQVGSHTPGSGALKLAFPSKLKVGRHRLGVSARDNAGNLRTKVVHFSLCRK